MTSSSSPYHREAYALVPADMKESPSHAHAHAHAHIRGRGGGPSAPTSALFSRLIPIINTLQDLFTSVQNNLNDGSATARFRAQRNGNGNGNGGGGGGGEEELDMPEISLPQIAVVGSQSSGKSSVLESLVGRDFLPRGAEICTRRPLVLQLIQSDVPEDYGEFLHLPGQRFTDFDRIRSEILAETEREAGSNKGVSPKQIRLKIFSRNVLTMTLVDLPGMTKVPVGDQPGDIETRIREMVMAYIRHETCVILAVSPANADLANSEALKMARQADPTGDRTLGVLTKLDIMDRGTDAAKALRNKIVPLKLGYVGVVNRCQADVNGNKSVQRAIEEEERFFESHESYKSDEVVRSRCGTQRLALELNSILITHIMLILPQLRHSLVEKMRVSERKLQSLGALHNNAKDGASALLLQLLTEFCANSRKILEGETDESFEEISEEIKGGARVFFIYREIFAKSIEQNFEENFEISDAEIRTVILNSSGIKGNLLISSAPFYLLVKQKIKRLLRPSLECSNLVHLELEKICMSAIPANVDFFPNLRAALSARISEFLVEHMNSSLSFISSLIDIQMGYINTSHSDFLSGNEAMKIAMRKENLGTPSDGADARSRARSTKVGHERSQYDEKENDARRTSSERLEQQYSPAASRHTSFLRNFNSSLSLKNPEPSKPSPAAAAAAATARFDEDDDSGTYSRALSTPTSHIAAADNHESTPVSQSKGQITLPAPPSQIFAKSDAISMNEKIEISVTRELLNSYSKIVLRQFQDLVPKTVHHFQVNSVSEKLQQYLIESLYKTENMASLMEIRSDVSDFRDRNMRDVDMCRQALEILDQVPGEIWKLRQHV